MKDRRVRNGGMSFISALTLLFITLKFTNNIRWSWKWVLSPIWISIISIVIVFFGILIAGRIAKGKW